MKHFYIEAYSLTEKNVSGIGHMTLELVRALDEHPENQKSFDVTLVVSRDRKDTLKRWGFKRIQIRTVFIPTRVFNLIWKYDLLPPMDLLLGRGIYIFPNYKNWRLAFSASMTFVCDISYLLYPEYVSPKNQKFLAKNIHKWVKRADKILAISTSARGEIIQYLHVAEEKILMVPCGVDTKMFYRRSENEIQKFKTRYKLGTRYILYLGNLEPRKNIERLIEAYKVLPKNIRKAYSLLIVGGGGWLNEPIMKAIKDAQDAGYNIIKPDVYISDNELPAMYSGAAMLIHPALYEGFGISPLQAMACGTPVIVANNSSLPEVVGDAALLVNAHEISDISDKMERILNDENLRHFLIERGLNQVKKYTWQKSAENLLNGAISK